VERLEHLSRTKDEIFEIYPLYLWVGGFEIIKNKNFVEGFERNLGSTYKYLKGSYILKIAKNKGKITVEVLNFRMGYQHVHDHYWEDWWEIPRKRIPSYMEFEKGSLKLYFLSSNGYVKYELPKEREKLIKDFERALRDQRKNEKWKDQGLQIRILSLPALIKTISDYIDRSCGR